MYVFNVSNMDDTIDSEDAVQFLQELKDERDDDPAEFDSEVALEALEQFVVELQDTFSESAIEFGIRLVRDSYWESYAEQYIEDVMEIPEHLEGYIDYEKFARDMKIDYTSVDYDGVTYWGRS